MTSSIVQFEGLLRAIVEFQSLRAIVECSVLAIVNVACNFAILTLLAIVTFNFAGHPQIANHVCEVRDARKSCIFHTQTSFTA